MACKLLGGSHRDLGLCPRHVRLPGPELGPPARLRASPRALRPGPSDQRTAAGGPTAVPGRADFQSLELPVLAAGGRCLRPGPGPRDRLSLRGPSSALTRTYRAPGAVRTMRDSHEPNSELALPSWRHSAESSGGRTVRGAGADFTERDATLGRSR